jgi:hypothetical protein
MVYTADLKSAGLTVLRVRVSPWALVIKTEGPVAQLGERLICIQEVIGSIPFRST